MCEHEKLHYQVILRTLAERRKSHHSYISISRSMDVLIQADRLRTRDVGDCSSLSFEKGADHDE
jgi:hypothetical protein